MNIKLLREIKKQILKEPKQFQMQSWFASNNILRKIHIPNCGTAACIGGWAITLARTETKKPIDGKDSFWRTEINVIPEKVLELTQEQGSKLFLMSNWPKQFNISYNKEGTREFARNAARRIEHFIKTNGEE